MGRVQTVKHDTGQGVPPTVEAFLEELGGPAVLRIPGRDRSRTRAVATLIHGDEPSGIRAVHGWLRGGRVPATDVVLFVGSVMAALESPGFAYRHLPGRVDLNRCFITPCEGQEGAVAREALAMILEAQPEALVDLHNTSGATPGFAIGEAPRLDLLCLAQRFVGSFLASWGRRIGSLVDAAGPRLPSVVIECGKSGDPQADRIAVDGLARYLDARDLWSGCDGEARLAVYSNPVRIQVYPWVRLATGTGPVDGADITLRPGLDRLNLTEVPPGEILGWVSRADPWPFLAMNGSEGDASRDLLEVVDGEIRTRTLFSAVMWTPRPSRALGDCLGYATRKIDPGCLRNGVADR